MLLRVVASPWLQQKLEVAPHGKWWAVASPRLVWAPGEVQAAMQGQKKSAPSQARRRLLGPVALTAPSVPQAND